VKADPTDDNVWRFANLAAAAADAGQSRIAVTTALYLVRHRARMIGDGRPLGPIAARPLVSATADLRGRDAAEVWERPGRVLRRALEAGKAPADAARNGLVRAEELALTGLQLAHTRTVAALLADDAEVGAVGRWPGLGGCCALCGLAGTVTVRPGEALPIHPRCACTAVPLYCDGPPRPTEAVRRLIAEKVSALTGSAEITPSAFERWVRVERHGEIGPMLTPRTQHFSGPSESSDTALSLDF
jgi:hypothetical protein